MSSQCGHDTGIGRPERILGDGVERLQKVASYDEELRSDMVRVTGIVR